MLGRWKRAPRRSLVVGAAVGTTLVLAAGVASASVTGLPLNPFGTSNVGTQSSGKVLLPDNQAVQPFGQRTEFTADTVGQAISPDGTKVAVQTGGEATGAAHVNILDASTNAVLQTFGGANDSPPVYSPDGTALYVGATTAASGGTGTNTVLKYTVDPSTGLVTDPTSPTTLTLPGNRDLPFGLAVSADGSTLYAALSGSNNLGVIDTATMQLVTEIPVGVAPAAVAIVGNEAFVANRGGQAPAAGQFSNSSYGTQVAASPVTNASKNGTVSVVDLSTNAVTGTIKVGLQPGALTVHDGSVFVTNTNSDSVSIVDAASHRVTQTFSVEPLPGSSIGASPSSVAFAGNNTLLVSVGADNAIAEFRYNGPRYPVQYEGLIPTDWYPNAVSYDSKVGKIFVGNEYGIGTNGAEQTHAMTGTVTSFALPSNRTLGTLTGQVFADNGWNHLPASNTPSYGPSRGPLPAIPTKLGAPSAIKHVFLLIKENRTYDQILGDIGKGNSDSSDTNFGATITPNEHSLSNTYTLFDNFYDPAQQSADGHYWILQANPDQQMAQSQAAIFARSYGDWNDPLNNQRDGFIWNTVQAAGKTVKDFGEDADAVSSGTVGTWQQYYADSQIMEGQATGTLPVSETAAQWASPIPDVRAMQDPSVPGFNLDIPDQYRVDVWEQDFTKELATNTVPNLSVLRVPNDHTGGVATADAQVADNDLATGRIISDISHSKVWKNSAVIVEEDDSQSGDDHVDGHRSPVWIASPYATRGVVNSDYYTQVNVDKTIEQILGAQPMNQYDRAAVPMFDAFTNKPNFTPYTTLPETVPLTQGVSNLIPLTPATGDSAATAKSVQATSGPAAPAAPAPEQSLAAQWATWDTTEAQPKLTGPHAVADSVNPAQMNRYDWYTSTNFSRPYPGDTRILAPDQVPGRNLDTDFSGD